jgi:hypothetical protein
VAAVQQGRRGVADLLQQKLVEWVDHQYRQDHAEQADAEPPP